MSYRQTSRVDFKVQSQSSCAQHCALYPVCRCPQCAQVLLPVLPARTLQAAYMFDSLAGFIMPCGSMAVDIQLRGTRAMTHCMLQRLQCHCRSAACAALVGNEHEARPGWWCCKSAPVHWAMCTRLMRMHCHASACSAVEQVMGSPSAGHVCHPHIGSTS